jgi:5-methylcytosine-specific restriction endonuclease McrA
MAKRKSANPLKRTNWAQYKASQARSSWRTRAKKYGENLDNIPTRIEIQKWLEDQMPLRCYFTGGFISNEVVELDHKIPICREGKFSLDNVAVTSRYYNNVKGSLTEEEFRSLLKTVNTWADKGSALFKRLMASNHVFNRGRK